MWMLISSLFPKENSTDQAVPTISGIESQDFSKPGEPPYLPVEGASAVGVDGIGVIATNGTTDPVPIASIAKTITTLVILEKIAPEHGDASNIQITFSEQDEAIRSQTIAENGASQPVTNGLSMSLHEALSVMMLASANNYATSLAIKTFGSMDAYIQAANNWLTSNGMTHTTVADASGLDPNTTGTASDLVNLGLIAMQNQEVVDIVTVPEISVSGVGVIANGNPMFGIDGVDGIKLGSTYQANNCLLYSKTVDVNGKAVRIVGVTLGLDEFSTIIEGAQTTLDQVASGLTNVELIPARTAFGTIKGSGGEELRIVNSEGFSNIYWPGVSVIATPKVTQQLEISPGSDAGTLEIILGQRAYSVPLSQQ